MVGDSILELGPAEGVMTELLAATGKKLTLVEGSSSILRFPAPSLRPGNMLSTLYSRNSSPTSSLTTSYLGMFWNTSRTRRHFIARQTVAHTRHGTAIRRGAKCPFLASAGSRNHGDLLREEDTLNEMDFHHGHRRVFNPETFRNAFSHAGLKIEIFGGYWMKPRIQRADRGFMDSPR